MNVTIKIFTTDFCLSSVKRKKKKTQIRSLRKILLPSIRRIYLYFIVVKADENYKKLKREVIHMVIINNIRHTFF